MVCGVGESVGVGNGLRKLPLGREEGVDGFALLLADALPVCCHAGHLRVVKY